MVAFEEAPYHTILFDTFQNLQPPSFLLLNMPPKSGKSNLLTLYSCWRLAKDPTVQILSLGFNLSNQKRDSIRARNVLESERFIQLYGQLLPQDGFNRIEKFITSSQGSREIGSFEGNTGRNCSVCIADDPQDYMSITSPEYRDKTNTFLSYLWSRIADQRRMTYILCQQKLHPLDSSQFFLDLLGDDPNFHHVNIPFLDEAGTPIHPRLGDLDKFRRLVGEDVWNAQYLMKPVLNDQLIDPQMIERNRFNYDVQGFTFASCDPAITANNRSDYTAVAIITVKDDVYYVQDVLRKRIAGNKIVDELVNFYKKHRCNYMIFEDITYTKTLLSQLQDRIAVKPIHTGGKDKLARSVAFLNRLEQDRIKFHKNLPEAVMNEFYNAGFSRFDDCFDAINYACMQPVATSIIHHGPKLANQLQKYKW